MQFTADSAAKMSKFGVSCAVERALFLCSYSALAISMHVVSAKAQIVILELDWLRGTHDVDTSNKLR